MDNNVKPFKKITSFKQMKEILEPIPADKFQTRIFGWAPNASMGKNTGKVDNGCSCFLGHIHRYFDPSDAEAYGDRHGYGARELTRMLLSSHKEFFYDGTDVNNFDYVNGYNEPEIKDRIMHMIEDGIVWENKALAE